MKLPTKTNDFENNFSDAHAASVFECFPCNFLIQADFLKCQRKRKNSKSFSRLTVLYSAAMGGGYSVFIKRTIALLPAVLLIAILKRREILSAAGDARLS